MRVVSRVTATAALRHIRHFRAFGFCMTGSANQPVMATLQFEIRVKVMVEDRRSPGIAGMTSGAIRPERPPVRVIFRVASGTIGRCHGKLIGRMARAARRSRMQSGQRKIR